MIVDIAYIYPSQNIPTPSEIESKVDPRQIKEDLTSTYRNFISFYCLI